MLTINWSTSILQTDDAGDLVASDTEHVLRFDAVTKEVHEWAGVSTEHPVEGPSISDHKTAQPDLLTLEVKVSNQPLGDPPPSGYAAGGVTSFVDVSDVVKGVSVRQFSREFDRVADVMFTLHRLAREPTLVTIITEGRTYSSVSIERVVMPRDSASDIRTFSLDLKEISTVTTREVAAPESREARGQRAGDRGSQEGREAAEGGGANESIAHRVLNAYQEDGGAGVLGLLQ